MKARPLQFFQDLIGDDFQLGTQGIPKNFVLYYDENKTQKMDIEKGDEWKTGVMTKLDIVYKLKDFTKDGILNWLDKNVKRKEYGQVDKRKFLKKLIESLLNSKKKYKLSDLTNNCYKLKEVVDDTITDIEHFVAKKTFDLLVKKGKIVANKEFEVFPSEKTIRSIQPDDFNKHLYEKAGKLNKEELALADKLDVLENVKWWYRNVEKEDFFIQGWHRNKFYPDFIVKTKSGKYIAVEYKGENLITNVDTIYKKELGEKWAKLAGKNYEFYLVGKSEIQEVIAKIKKM